MAEYKIRNDVKYITFDILKKYDFIKAIFTTKEGGISKGMFATMNLSFTRGDEKEAVEENYRRLFKECELTLENIVMSDQIHETSVYVVKEDDIKKLGSDLSNRRLKDIDGMITNVKNVPLVTFYADCVPLYFVDPINKAVGMSHSGWRGTAKGMGIKTVEAMQKEYGSNPKDIIGIVGPSICRKCYEVSEDVVKEMEKSYKDKFDISQVYDKKDNGKYNLDLWLLNKHIMQLAGLQEKNIEVSSICTACNSDVLFSHRITQGKRGNLAGIIEIV